MTDTCLLGVNWPLAVAKAKAKAKVMPHMAFKLFLSLLFGGKFRQ